MATPATKARRVIEDHHWPQGEETAEGTTATGLKLLQSLRRSQDKTGRLVATEFLQLPPRSNTEYYRQIKLPLSFQEIENKLNARQYGTMTALESDLKRMVQNAKEFNVTGSKVYEDAERIRKALSNFMPKHNPAYKDEGYRAVPTPVPEDNEGNDDASAQHTTPAPHTIKLIVNGTGGGTTGGTRTKGDTPIAGDEDIRDQQLKIVQEMIELRDPDDAETEITLEFYEKPPKRDYPDYYRQISHPTALKDIQKAVSNNKLPTWESFITEVEYLWENARTYNEEGSFIHENANKLRDWFVNRLSGIEGSRDIMLPKKLKLNPPKNPPQQTTPRIKFTNLNKDKTQPGITVDEEARRRQNEHVKAAARGQVFKSTETPVRMSQRGSVNRDLPHVAAPEANVGAASKSSEPVASVSGVDKQENAQGDIKMADVPPETDKANVPSVAQTITQGDSSTTTMQPPAVVPQQFQQSQAVPHPPLRPVYPVNPVTTAFDRVTRDPGKDASTALYRAIRIETHPDLRHPSPWAIPAFPEDKQTQFGFSVTLPASHNWLRVTLWLSDECLSRSQHRAVVSRDMIEIVPEHPEANGKCVYRLKLHQGVNTICIDTVANIEKRGEPAPVWPAERHHFERFTLTAHLLNEY